MPVKTGYDFASAITLASCFAISDPHLSGGCESRTSPIWAMRAAPTTAMSAHQPANSHRTHPGIGALGARLAGILRGSLAIAPMRHPRHTITCGPLLAG